MEDLIKEFRIAISNILLYPPESRLIKDSLTTCHKILSDALKKEKTFIISESEGKILANGKPIEAQGGIFLDSLYACNIKSITFKPGFTQGELYTFLRNLSEKQKAEPKGLPHIEINEKVYVSIGEKDIVIEKGKEGIAPQEKILQTLGELSSLMNSIDNKEIKKRIKLEVVKRFSLDDSEILSELLKSKPEISADLFGEVKEEAPTAVAPSVQISPVEEVKTFLKKDTSFLLKDEVLQKIPTLLQSLRSPNELELASELCDKLAANLEASITDVRLKTVISFKKLYSIIESLTDKKIVERVDEKFIETGRKETNSQIYQELASLLEHAANRYLKEGDYAKTHAITGMFSEHVKSMEFEERKKHARATIDRLVSSELTRLLVDDLSSTDESKQSKASSILLDLGESCASPLIQKIKETSDLRLRKSVADLLVKIGNEAVNQLIKELEADTSLTPSLRILDVLDGIGHEAQVVEGLHKELANPNFQVRRKTLDILCQIGTEPAKEVLLEAVDDESYIIKERAIEFLGDMKYEPAVPKLIKLIESKEEKETVQVEACKSLGKIGNPSSIPILFKMTSPKTIFSTGKSREIRIAAIEALSKLGDDRIKKFINDKDPFVRKITREAIGSQNPLEKEPD
ncbi:MAG: HEAT repeat domain-containing protein [bacterium]|nr:HEAT repeat domain-containing protein [bacterium]